MQYVWLLIHVHHQVHIIKACGKDGRRSNCPHICLNLQDSQMMDMLSKIEVCVYMRWCAGLATATSHQDLLTRARDQGVCFHNAPAQSSWPVAITSPAHQHTYACVRWQTALFSVTCPSSVDLTNSIEYVGDSLSYLSYACSLLYAPDISETCKYMHLCAVCSYELSSF